MNAFDAYSEAAKPAYMRRREQGVARRAARKAAEDRLRAEEDMLDRLYRQGKRAEVDLMLAGPHGQDIRGLRAFLHTMTPSSAPALVSFVERAGWITAADRDTRHFVLGMISSAIARVRTRDGLEPFDDALWDEPPTAFQIVRDRLGALP